jgi:transcription termination/antitermination factor NusG
MTSRWYAVHAYSNFENKVMESIREQAKQRGLSALFEEILVPKEKVVEVRRGRKIDAERKFFPGYVLVKMEMTDEAYHLIKNTPKVTGFLGSDNKPMPLSEAEAQRIIHQVQEGIERPKPGRWKRSTKDARASKSRCRSSAARPRSNWSSDKSRSCSFRVQAWEVRRPPAVDIRTTNRSKAWRRRSLDM